MQHIYRLDCLLAMVLGAGHPMPFMAQISKVFTYQGRLSDSNIPANGESMAAAQDRALPVKARSSDMSTMVAVSLLAPGTGYWRAVAAPIRPHC